ncbi:hypothetical protein RDV89_12885 [Nocardioides zeae]|uniref:ABC transporter permease n=1 Tax=Nocardioides imazamoxiresistens TaxID=3231893 RepID=A0ABU3PYX6_9ACTN|nr:hypothetical protein [Nocardioides zeae]MDT9593970.1 hypothetical protein [Nocardioides zeae]
MSTIDLTPASYRSAAEGAGDFDPAAPDRRSGSGMRRVLGMARANALLLTRNRMTLAYALLLPLAPLAFLLAADRGSEAAGISSIGQVVLLAALFPVYYNLLSLTVTRRDELVLKRLRTGEATDRDQLVSMALPGVVTFGIVSLLGVGAALALGQPMPSNPVVLAVGLVVVAVTFAGLAFWTAAWTKNAEAAQLTSMPVLLVAIVGSLWQILPERAHDVLAWTPGAAIDAIVRIGWFGQEVDGTAVSFTDSFVASAQPLAALVAWAALAVVLTRRSMRWEPRG